MSSKSTVYDEMEQKSVQCDTKFSSENQTDQLDTSQDSFKFDPVFTFCHESKSFRFLDVFNEKDNAETKDATLSLNPGSISLRESELDLGKPLSMESYSELLSNFLTRSLNDTKTSRSSAVLPSCLQTLIEKNERELENNESKCEWVTIDKPSTTFSEGFDVKSSSGENYMSKKNAETQTNSEQRVETTLNDEAVLSKRLKEGDKAKTPSKEASQKSQKNGDHLKHAKVAPLTKENLALFNRLMISNLTNSSGFSSGELTSYPSKWFKDSTKIGERKPETVKRDGDEKLNDQRKSSFIPTPVKSSKSKSKESKNKRETSKLLESSKFKRQDSSANGNQHPKSKFKRSRSQEDRVFRGSMQNEDKLIDVEALSDIASNSTQSKRKTPSTHETKKPKMESGSGKPSYYKSFSSDSEEEYRCSLEMSFKNGSSSDFSDESKTLCAACNTAEELGVSEITSQNLKKLLEIYSCEFHQQQKRKEESFYRWYHDTRKEYDSSLAKTSNGFCQII